MKIYPYHKLIIQYNNYHHDCFWECECGNQSLWIYKDKKECEYAFLHHVTYINLVNNNYGSLKYKKLYEKIS